MNARFMSRATVRASSDQNQAWRSERSRAGDNGDRAPNLAMIVPAGRSPTAATHGIREKYERCKCTKNKVERADYCVHGRKPAKSHEMGCCAARHVRLRERAPHSSSHALARLTATT